MKYTEVKLILKDGDVAIKTTANKIIISDDTTVKEINFQKEKENIKKELTNNGDTQQTAITSSKHRKRR
jgi:hypothetical protein